MSEQKTRPEGQGAKRRVLIIEDNIDAADTLREILEMEGHVAEVAYSGTEGLEKAASFEPNVVFCDIGLPDIDGLAVARAMRQEPKTRRALLVALSGFTRRHDIDEALAAGFDEHLAKPPNLDAIDRLLRRTSLEHT
jgi:two-component system CheB/CheR fusion protein